MSDLFLPVPKPAVDGTGFDSFGPTEDIARETFHRMHPGWTIVAIELHEGFTWHWEVTAVEDET